MSTETVHALIREALARAPEPALDEAFGAEPDEPLVVRVRGRCMEPLAVDGDLAEVVAGQPRVGDIVLAQLDGVLVCHRVLATPLAHGGDYLLAGDRSWRLDTHATDSVLGVVRALRRAENGSILVLDLERDPWSRLGAFQARLHRVAQAQRDRAWARPIEWLRRLVLQLRALAWRGLFTSPRRLGSPTPRRGRRSRWFRP